MKRHRGDVFIFPSTKAHWHYFQLRCRYITFKSALVTTPLSFQMHIIFASILFMFLVAWSAKLYGQTYDENQLSPNNSIGAVPYSSMDGLHEAISLSSGALNIRIPLLSLPQRNGRTLDLAYVYNSKTYNIREQQFVTGGGGESPQSYSWIFSYVLDCLYCNPAYPIKLNLPSLRADIKYIATALYQIPAGTNTYPILQLVDVDQYGNTVNVETGLDGGTESGTVYGTPEYCVVGWIFTDWQGVEHQFGNMRDCPSNLGEISQSGVFIDPYNFGSSNLNESRDGSFIRLDTHNPSDIVVTERDGTRYDFLGYTPPPHVESDWPDYYIAYFSTMTDANGNIVRYNANKATITDTLGRQINLANDISYMDSDGSPQLISTTLSQTSSTTYTFFNPPVASETTPNSNQNPCYLVGPYPGGNANAFQVNFGSWSVTGPASTTMNINYPGGKQYVLTFDVLGQLIKIQYPGGGYTRYDYSSNASKGDKGGIRCAEEFHEVSAKHVCMSASGDCSTETEATTTYTPTITFEDPDNGQMTYNTEMDVTDPLGNLTKHIFRNMNDYGQFTSPKEQDTYIYNGASSLLRTVHVDYITNPASGLGSDLDYPQTITTTYNDISPNISKKIIYQYDTQNIAPPGRCSATTTLFDNNASCATSPIMINNITRAQETDFNGNVIKTTVTAWEKGGQYDGATAHILDKVSSRTVTDNINGTFKTETYSYDTMGDVTQDVITATGIPGYTTSYTPLDQYGRPTQITDPKGYVTKLSYADNWGNSACTLSDTSAYLTGVTLPDGELISYSYFPCTGMLASKTDPNLKTTAYAYDEIGRKIAECDPDSIGLLWSGSACNISQASTSIAYDDRLGANTVTTTRVMNQAGGAIVSKVALDGLSNPVQTTVQSDPSGVTEIDNTYDLLERLQAVTNPYRPGIDSTWGITSYLYDALNRKTYQCQPDNLSTPSTTCIPTHSYRQWIYVGNVTTFRDENGSQWQQTLDALGRFSKILEPNGSNTSPLMETDYSYDAMDNILSVTQKGVTGDVARNRTFAYDGLSRLVCASNPESSGASCPTSDTGAYTAGTTGYTYDANSNIRTRTDARGFTTTYGYDDMNRLMSKSYSDLSTPWSCYQYSSSSVTNGIGRLSAAWTQAASIGSCPVTAPNSNYWTKRIILAYDAMGRLKSEQQYTPASSATNSFYAPAYTYDLTGNLISSTDGTTPSPTNPGQTLTFTSSYDGAGHLATVISNWVNSTHPSSIFSAQSTATTPCANSSTTPYAAFGGLQNAAFGGGVLTLNRAFDVRLRLNCEIDTGGINSSAKSGAATITITGTEQTK